MIVMKLYRDELDYDEASKSCVTNVTHLVNFHQGAFVCWFTRLQDYVKTTEPHFYHLVEGGRPGPGGTH